MVGEITQFGVSSNGDSNPTGICVVNANNMACVPDNPAILGKVQSLVGSNSSLVSFDESEIFLPGNGGSCVGEGAHFFIQHTCVMNASQQDAKFRQLALFSCTAIFIAFFYFFCIRHLIGTHIIAYEEWDIATVSASVIKRCRRPATLPT